MSEKIVVSGGTGFLGRALVRRLSERGAEVAVLSRARTLPKALSSLSSVSAVPWDAASDGDWQSSVEGASAVVHLAGEQAVGRRFTKGLKRRIFESRVKSADLLVRAISRASSRPRVFLSASGSGYYGSRDGDALLDESAPPGTDFMARVCVAWEEAARAAEPYGVRVVCTRISPVLGRDGGSLPVMALPFRLFVGGPLGPGTQVFPWIHLADAVAALERCLDDGSLSGPVNIVAPNAVTQRELARAMGRALHRPSFFFVPSFVLRLLFGEGAVPIITGHRAVPAKLESAGFRFRYPTIEAALAEAFAPAGGSG